MCKKRLNRQQTAHKCIHVTTCVQLGGKEFAMLSRGYLIYVSAACPFKYARLYCVISFDLKCTANKWVQGHCKVQRGNTNLHYKGSPNHAILSHTKAFRNRILQYHMN